MQIVHSSRRGSRDIEHIGSAHDDAELELLKAVARQRLAAGQGELELGLERTEPARRGAGGGPLPITSSRMGHLLDALAHVYRVLGFADAAGGDEVFFQLVLARIIEPVSKLDSLRVLEEGGIAAASYRTVKRRLPVDAKESWRQQLSDACAPAGLGRTSPAPHDVSTPYFETDAGAGSSEPGFSTERGWNRRSPSACCAAHHDDDWERAVSEFARRPDSAWPDSLYRLAIGRATLVVCRSAYNRWVDRAGATSLSTWISYCVRWQSALTRLSFVLDRRLRGG